MRKILIPMFVVATLYSCSNSDDDNFIDPNAKYLNGYFITNEGNFNKLNGAVSHISSDFNTISNDIFQSANGKSIGDVVQSMVVYGDYAFVIVNNSNTIEVVDKKTFQSVHTITEELSSPNYAVINNNKLYVTSLYDSTVNVYNAEDYSFIKKIELDFAAGGIVSLNNYVYTANGFYSGGMSVEIINTTTDTNTKDLVFDSKINGIEANGHSVYVLETSETSSKITKINGENTLEQIDLPHANARYLAADNSKLYYTAGTGIYQLSDVLTETSSKLFDVASNGDSFSILYGFEVFDGKIFTSDANGFTDKGSVTIYNEDGSKIKEFNVGVGPNGFFKF